MLVNREKLLQQLESVDAGLAVKEIVEQSSCFVFKGGRVMTFSGEVACAAKSPLTGIEGAVPAKPLKELLARLKDDDVDIEFVDGKLKIKSKIGRGAVAMESDIALPVDQVEEPEDWVELDAEFCDAIAIVQECAASDDNNYRLTCVHMTPDYVEACDNHQMARYPLKTGLTGKSMIKRDSIKHVVTLGMTEVSETETWLHFRNPSGLVLSCRRWTDEYNTLEGIIEGSGGEPTTLPGGLEETVGRSQIFSSAQTDGNLIQIKIKKGRMLIRGEGVEGYWEEQKKVKYNGPAISFMIAPALLSEISNRTHECLIGPTSLRIDSGKFIYITSLEG